MTRLAIALLLLTLCGCALMETLLVAYVWAQDYAESEAFKARVATRPAEDQQ